MPIMKLLGIGSGSYEDESDYRSKELLAIGAGNQSKNNEMAKFQKFDDNHSIITLFDPTEGRNILFVLFHRGECAGKFAVYQMNGEPIGFYSEKECKWYLELLAHQEKVLATNMLLMFEYELRNWLVEALHKTEKEKNLITV